ncbi:decaprenyl-phosphate phosphoribosyltransferase [bacterium]|nr:decaprenyl-phosphate phosphoribosyltransferase [candidate division CSSED10-310 bacterium]
MLTALIETMRPRQWTKNFVIFAGILFTQNLHVPHLLLKTIVAFFLFCMISGSVYIFNDVLDYKRDLAHPQKKFRPIASGRFPRHYALIAGSVICLLTLFFSFIMSIEFGSITLIYFLLNLAYSMYLKNIVILDVIIIASGFVLRAVAGARVIEVSVSHWLLVCTFLLALFLALCKRRHELKLIEDNAANHRAVLVEYSSKLLDQMVAIVTAGALMAYALYTISPEVTNRFGTDKLVYTVPFVLFAIFRYLYLVLNRNLGGSPERVLIQDKAMVIDIVLWVIAVVGILYFTKIKEQIIVLFS